MVSWKLLELNRFMVRLLKSDAFDCFLLREGLVRTYMEYRFSGTLYPEYFDTAEQEARSGALSAGYVAWGEVRPYVLSLVKGQRTPLAFRFVLELPGEERGGEEAARCLQIRFEHGEGHIVTGLVRGAFSLDRSQEEAWDEEARELLRTLEIAVEE